MKRILVVDDNTEYLQVLSSVLSGDFDTIKATGVKEALDILQAVTVDAICSDLNIGLPAEIEARQKQYEYYRDALLSFNCSHSVNVERES